MRDTALRAADLRRSGVELKTIARSLNVTVAEAFALAREGGWEPARWPLLTTRVTEDGYAYFVRAPADA